MIFEETLRHSVEELSKYEKIFDQYEFRKDIILETLEKNQIPYQYLYQAIVGRGGLFKAYRRWTYKVNEKMLEDLKIGVLGEHASNLGGIIAYEIGEDN